MHASAQQMDPRAELQVTGSGNLLGLHFARLSPTRFASWVRLSLMTPGNKTMLFVDASSLNHCVSHPSALATLKHADLLIPRGRALQLQLPYSDTDSAQTASTQTLYDELFLELELRKLKVVMLATDKSAAREAEAELIRRYPGLAFSIETLNDQYQFSTTELAERLTKDKMQVVISLLPSPKQERLLSRLNRLMTDQLMFGIGEGLPESLMELNSHESSLFGRLSVWARKRRHSILLRPHQWIGFIGRTLMSKLSSNSEPTPLNLAMSGGGWRARLYRTLIAAKASSFRLRRALGQVFKRAIDLIGVGTGLLLLSPLLLVVALVIKLTSPGPIFYSQMRVGLRGKLFRMWKFRSMYTDADKRKAELEAQNEMAGGVLFKMKHDPRITPIGRVIRRLSIDELPQLLNVLSGEMSLVGPRPALPKEVEAYPVLARARLEVKPGLTGLWQISGRSDLPFDKQVLLDTAYVHTQSTTNDIKLIAKTIPAVVSGKGAY